MYYYFFSGLVLFLPFVLLTWRRNFVISYIGISIFLIFYVMPFLYFLEGIEADPRVSDQIFMLFLTGLSCSFIFLFLIFTSRRYSLDSLGCQVFYGKNRLVVPAKIAIPIALLVLIGKIFEVLMTSSIGLDVSRGELRLENYDEAMSEGSFGFVKTLLSIFYYYFVVCIYIVGKRRLSIILFFMIVVVDFIIIAKTSMHRSPLIFLLLLSVFFIHMFVRRVKNIGVYFFIGILIVPVYLAVAAKLRAGMDADINSNYVKVFAYGFSGLNTFDQVPVLIKQVESGDLRLEYGKQLLYSFMTPIPRVIWQDKPNISFSSRKSIEIYGS